MSKTPKKTRPIDAVLVCWNFANWPEDVYPHDAAAGRHLVREHRSELLEAGALVRVGREIVVLGVPYITWLKQQKRKVLEFELPCNQPQHAAKRNNGAARADAA